MTVQAIYDDGSVAIYQGDTWSEIVSQIGCTAISLTVISPELLPKDQTNVSTE